MPNGSATWRASAWQRLLAGILQIEARLPERPPFTFGGGTALAVDLEHRISYDIDLFYRSADALDLYNPNRNADVKRLIEAHGGSWQDPGSYLKLELGPQAGEIDIVISRLLTENPALPWPFEDVEIQRERPREIIAKKIRYRSSQFKRRDIFDLAAVISWAPDEISPAFAAVAEKLPLLRDRIATMDEDYRRGIRDDVQATTTGEALLNDAPEICIACLDGYLRRMRAGR